MTSFTPTSPRPEIDLTLPSSRRTAIKRSAMRLANFKASMPVVEPVKRASEVLKSIGRDDLVRELERKVLSGAEDALRHPTGPRQSDDDLAASLAKIAKGASPSSGAQLVRDLAKWVVAYQLELTRRQSE